MAKNFTQFSTATPLTTGDYIVGYKQDGSTELKATIKQIVDLVQDSDNQTLSFNEGTKDLLITGGNTVSLSSLAGGASSGTDTEVRSLTSNWQGTYTTVQSNSANWATWTDPVTSLSTYYVTINNVVYGIPAFKPPLLPMSGVDNASLYSSWSNGDNQGTGFNPWDIVINNGSGFAGIYLNSSAGQGFGNIDTSGTAFGAYANPQGSGALVTATRPLASPLTIGNAVSAAIATAYRSGGRGFQILDSINTLLYSFEVTFDEYRVDGVNQNWAYSQTSIINIVAKQIDTNTINVIATRGSDVSNKNIPGVVDKIRFYISATNGGSDLENIRFNSLKLYPFQ